MSLSAVPRSRSRSDRWYDSAAKRGYYAIEQAGLSGKKDHVRRYWEDMAIKTMVRPALEERLRSREAVRIVDLGAGSGEGIELLTRIPRRDRDTGERFLLDLARIDAYVGVDISAGMVEQGRRNYAGHDRIAFAQADLGEGFPLRDAAPFDLYFSSYSSLSHISAERLARLTEEVFRHAGPTGHLVFDLFGRLSLEWPDHWARVGGMLPYHMSWLLPPEQRTASAVAPYPVAYWTAEELRAMVDAAAQAAGRTVELTIMDRSLFVSRHSETGAFNGQPRPWRAEVNRLFDRDFRGDWSSLRVDLDFLAPYRAAAPEALGRLEGYRDAWNAVIAVAEALCLGRDDHADDLIAEAEDGLAPELDRLRWLVGNAARFPVVDFWASEFAPQVACILRNLEFRLPPGLGCGHGMLAVATIRG